MKHLRLHIRICTRCNKHFVLADFILTSDDHSTVPTPQPLPGNINHEPVSICKIYNSTLQKKESIWYHCCIGVRTFDSRVGISIGYLISQQRGLMLPGLLFVSELPTLSF